MSFLGKVMVHGGVVQWGIAVCRRNIDIVVLVEHQGLKAKSF